MYIDQGDIEDVFGVDNVAVWSNLQNDSTSADTSRITTAIAYAEQEVNDRFRMSMYQVPFTESESGGLYPVKNWCAVLAGAWLFRSRLLRGQGGDGAALIVGQRSAALNEMDEYLSGARQLGCAFKSDQSEAPMIV